MIHIIYNTKTVNTLIHGTFYFSGKMCETSNFHWIIITWAFCNDLNILHSKYLDTTNYFITRKIATSLTRQITPKGWCTNIPNKKSIRKMLFFRIFERHFTKLFLSTHWMLFITILLFTCFWKMQFYFYFISQEFLWKIIAHISDQISTWSNIQLKFAFSSP